MRVPLVVPVLVTLCLAGCGGGTGAGPPTDGVPPPPPANTARADLAARAAAAQDLVVVAFYDLDDRGTAMVVRAQDGSWRVDVPGGALGGTVDVSWVHADDQLFQCRLPAPVSCVPVSELTGDLDPRWQHVFTTWLDVFTDRGAPLAVSAAEPLAGAEGDCYSVEPTAASLLAPVDPGIYCFAVDGMLTGARLDMGTLTMTGTGQVVPPTAELPGPVVAGGEPLPTAAPPASPSPSPDRSPGPSPEPPPAP